MLKDRENNTVCKRILGSFSPEILQAGVVKGLTLAFEGECLLCAAAPAQVSLQANTLYSQLRLTVTYQTSQQLSYAHRKHRAMKQLFPATQ